MDQLLTLTIYSRPGCHLCVDMKRLVEKVVGSLGIDTRIEEVDIESDPRLEALYGHEIPVLLVNGRKAAKYRITEEQLRRLLLGRQAR